MADFENPYERYNQSDVKMNEVFSEWRNRRQQQEYAFGGEDEDEIDEGPEDEKEVEDEPKLTHIDHFFEAFEDFLEDIGDILKLKHSERTPEQRKIISDILKKDKIEKSKIQIEVRREGNEIDEATQLIMNNAADLFREFRQRRGAERSFEEELFDHNRRMGMEEHRQRIAGYDQQIVREQRERRRITEIERGDFQDRLNEIRRRITGR